MLRARRCLLLVALLAANALQAQTTFRIDEAGVNCGSIRSQSLSFPFSIHQARLSTETSSLGQAAFFRLFPVIQPPHYLRLSATPPKLKSAWWKVVTCVEPTIGNGWSA
jgi:hypothetical protein